MFIDELHTLVGAGGAEGAIDASNILKPALARGEVQCVGATTLDEYRKHIEKDAALERRFQPVFVDEPSIEDTVKILQHLKNRYEKHHGVKISSESVSESVSQQGPHASVNVHYIAIEPGDVTFADGTHIIAGLHSTTSKQGRNTSGAKLWDTITFSSSFASSNCRFISATIASPFAILAYICAITSGDLDNPPSFLS